MIQHIGSDFLYYIFNFNYNILFNVLWYFYIALYHIILYNVISYYNISYVYIVTNVII